MRFSVSKDADSQFILIQAKSTPIFSYLYSEVIVTSKKAEKDFLPTLSDEDEAQAHA